MTLEASTGYWVKASEPSLSRDLKLSLSSPVSKRLEFNIAGIAYHQHLITQECQLPQPFSLTIADSQGLFQLDPRQSDSKIRQIHGQLEYCTNPQPKSQVLDGNWWSRFWIENFTDLPEKRRLFGFQGYEIWPTAAHQLVLGCSLETLHRISWNSHQPLDFLVQKMIASVLATGPGILGHRPTQSSSTRLTTEFQKLYSYPGLLVQMIND